jgi:hypothetical protein
VLQLGLAFYGLAVISLVAAATGIVFGPEWIERFTGLEPDAGSGSFEWLLVAVPAAAAILLAIAGHAMRRAVQAS